MKNLALAMVISMVLAAPALALDPGVYDYELVSVHESGVGAVTCTLQATFCDGCNPNDSNLPGCPEFTHGFPFPYCPYTYYDFNACYFDSGRFAAVRLAAGANSWTQKLVLNTTNWPLQGGPGGPGDKYRKALVLSGLPLSAGDQVEVCAEFFCSWCGHYYPCCDTVTIAPPAAVPALTNWGLIIFGVVLLGFISFVFLRRKKEISVGV